MAALIGSPPAEVPPVDWADVQARLGMALPADFRAFAAAYGPINLGEYVWIWSPAGCEVPYHVRNVGWLRSSRDAAPGSAPYRFWPEPRGLLWWAMSRAGDDFFWDPSGSDDPYTWPVIARFAHSRRPGCRSDCPSDRGGPFWPRPPTLLFVISEVDYSLTAGDLWRWVPEAADMSIAEFIERVARGGSDRRPQLSAKDQWLLLVYAKRSAFAALRRSDADLVRNAAIAVSLVTEEHVGDDRVIWAIIGLVCHARRRVGGSTFVGAEDWIASADPTVRTAFSRMLDSDRGLGFDSGRREVVTSAGRVLLGDDQCRYAPTVDLIGVAYRVADLLEADRYHVEDITIADELYLFPFDHVGDVDVVAADRRQVAAVKVTALVDGEPYQPIEVFVVEYPTTADASLVASAGDRWDIEEEIQIAVSSGVVLALLCVRYREQPYTETLADLERFRAGLNTALAGVLG